MQPDRAHTARFSRPGLAGVSGGVGKRALNVSAASKAALQDLFRDTLFNRTCIASKAGNQNGPAVEGDHGGVIAFSEGAQRGVCGFGHTCDNRMHAVAGVEQQDYVEGLFAGTEVDNALKRKNKREHPAVSARRKPSDRFPQRVSSTRSSRVARLARWVRTAEWLRARRRFSGPPVRPSLTAMTSETMDSATAAGDSLPPCFDPGSPRYFGRRARICGSKRRSWSGLCVISTTAESQSISISEMSPFGGRTTTRSASRKRIGLA